MISKLQKLIGREEIKFALAHMHMCTQKSLRGHGVTPQFSRGAPRGV